MSFTTRSTDSVACDDQSNAGDYFDDNSDFSLSELAFVMEWDDDLVSESSSSSGRSGVCPLGALYDSEVSCAAEKKEADELAARRKCYAEDLCSMISNIHPDGELKNPFGNCGDWRNVDTHAKKLSSDMDCLGSTPTTCAVW
mmetsp:Transcript_54859/g.128248  ORF Transcript_54859/g.128248 Transcript_54859/m.128248 type:complete len:142 (-) Transcript_54859:52-477(-)|eukprot:CAMPEP_0177723402 /NCGR_PEP_ID=MMETSP0484_2-20121128/18193_1 /TAXON_ID=354590 /ORGANISM="Rhodomonas lens, Strain RHODO" /LENGTH=141 /DNA_ID=CAMNT_0019235835 /DNA_START=132 /DNA_END=554 /DNA_ORIENTATION=+